MNIVFLDVDGELTYAEYKNPNTANIDISKVQLLKQICDTTNAKVVISSSWREAKNQPCKIYEKLCEILKNNNIEVIGDTPFIPEENSAEINKSRDIEVAKIQLKYGTGRGAEIQKWIQEHDVDNFAILDDEDWCWEEYGYDTHWVQPTWFGNGGLHQEHVNKAIKILNGE